MHLKKPVSNGILESWSLELNNNNISEIHNDDISSETVQKKRESFKVWPYIFAFIIFFILPY